MVAVTAQLSDDDRNEMGLRPLMATHNLHQHELFTDRALTALLKIAVHRAAKRLELTSAEYRHQPPTLRMDADAPNGVVALAEASGAL